MTDRAVLDTSVFIAAESGRPLDTTNLPAEFALSVVTLAELRAGVLARYGDAGGTAGDPGVGRRVRAAAHRRPGRDSLAHFDADRCQNATGPCPSRRRRRDLPVAGHERPNRRASAANRGGVGTSPTRRPPSSRPTAAGPSSPRRSRPTSSTGIGSSRAAPKPAATSPPSPLWSRRPNGSAYPPGSSPTRAATSSAPAP